ncbi:DUF1330 domain-containing protein [Methylobacterium sp. ID0610]|uniref:DUF1330 domain-containing protein n=1 Tax=Methylobacterium carpenticola TaxID=3344827 RepID=UPI0036A8B05C
MPKGYWVARVDVHNAEAYKNYVAANGAAFAKFGGRFIVRGGAFETALGTSRQRNVVIEFPSHADAVACWNSPEYQAARAKQEGGAEIDLVIVEGYDGPQPSLSAPAQPANPASE